MQDVRFGSCNLKSYSVIHIYTLGLEYMKSERYYFFFKFYFIFLLRAAVVTRFGFLSFCYVPPTPVRVVENS
ncbi:hypothetical protein RIF29_13044 [Crotalaria pallida]|uniref:Uncharacterized protein n=1 Tax=Crotalaria pallida TaxID=3830 RepID=A0AAN9INU5_CROPI